MLGRAVFYAAAKAQEVLHFWGEFAAVSPDELVTEGGSFYLPDDVVRRSQPRRTGHRGRFFLSSG